MRALGLAFILAFALTTVAANAQSVGQSQVDVPGGSGTTYSSSNPLLPLSGGLGPQVIGTPTTATTDFFEGDSITFGYGINNQATYGCTGSPGLCFADLVNTFDGTTEVNTGVPGTCLEYSSQAGGACNNNSSTVGSLIDRYAHDFTSLTATSRFHLMIGTNDLQDLGGGLSDPNITTTNFAANLLTVTNAAAAIVCPSGNVNGCYQQNMVLEEIPYSRKFFMPMWYALNSIIANLAVQKGYSLAATAGVIPVCAMNNWSGTPDICQNTTGSDFIHPDNLGHAAIATAIENASYGTALAEQASQSAVVSPLFFQNSANLTNYNWCQGMYACLSAQPTLKYVTATGFQSLENATTGSLYDTAYGTYTCLTLTTGTNDTCIGYQDQYTNSTGHDNTTVGYYSAKFLTSSYVSSLGSLSCYNLTTGNHDLCDGYEAGEYYNGTTGANTTMTQSEMLGDFSAPLANGDTGEIVLGYNLTGRGSHSTAIQADSTTPGFYSGTGVPTFSAPNASIYLRYDGGTGSRWYANTSGASTSGTTWTAQSSP